VVASEDGEAVLVAHFESDEESYCLDRVVSPVNIVTHEEVVGVRRSPTFKSAKSAYQS